MAIFSFNHDTFGKTTNNAGAAAQNAAYNSRASETKLDGPLHENGAAANAAYNARDDATYAIRSHVIPPGPAEAAQWFLEQEKGERKNARMSDRFIGALPRELTPEQCIEAVELFCREVTGDRVPWHFALHLELDKKGEPDWNPHVHIIFRDRDIETGRRVLYTSAGPKERAQLDKKGIQYWSTKDFRVSWGTAMNRALERAGNEARVDHRTLAEQGIDRDAEIHVGPGSKRAADKGHSFESRDQFIGDRAVPYSALDQGTRAEFNARIIDHNNRAAPGPAGADNSSNPKMREAEVLRQLYAGQATARRDMRLQQQLDRKALRQFHVVQLDQHKAERRELYKDARQAAFDDVKQQLAPKWKEVRGIKNRDARDEAALALKVEQKHIYTLASEKHVAAVRPVNDAAWRELRTQQLGERDGLRDTHRKEAAALARQQAAERSATIETFRSAAQQRAINRAVARIPGGQGMVAQNAAALAALRSKLVNGPGNEAPALKNPTGAAKNYREAARTEAHVKDNWRSVLNDKRAQHISAAENSAKAPVRSQGPPTLAPPAHGHNQSQARSGGGRER